MVEKYFISPEEGVVIGCKYHLRFETCTLGALTRHCAIMEGWMQNFFVVGRPEPSFPQRNKMRFEFRIGRKKFLEALAEMGAHGIVVTSTRNLERVMR